MTWSRHVRLGQGKSGHIMSYQEKINSGKVERGRSDHFKVR